MTNEERLQIARNRLASLARKRQGHVFAGDERAVIDTDAEIAETEALIESLADEVGGEEIPA